MPDPQKQTLAAKQFFHQTIGAEEVKDSETFRSVEPGDHLRGFIPSSIDSRIDAGGC